MRSRFEGDVRGFSELAKSEQEAETGSADLEPVIDWHLNRAAKRQGTSIDTQREIFDIQKTKQEVMLRLKERLRCLDDAGCELPKIPGARPAEYLEAEDRFRCVDAAGKEQWATTGDVLTDLAWDVKYDIRKGDAPRSLIKRYYVELAKQELGELLDRQIIKSEVGGTDAHEFKKEAYLAVDRERESGVEQKRTGIIAERMVKNLLKKAVIDHGLPVEIHETDIYEDVEQKIDFIIHRTDHRRGVGVDAADLPSTVGIQFSINTEAKAKKERQVERARRELDDQSAIDDILLVVMPINGVRRIHDEWERQGRPPGGPDALLPRHMAEILFQELLKGAMDPDEIAKNWENIGREFHESDKRP